MASSTITKAPPFSLPCHLTSTLRTWNHFPADAAVAGTVSVGKVGTLELINSLLAKALRPDPHPAPPRRHLPPLIAAGVPSSASPDCPPPAQPQSPASSYAKNRMLVLARRVFDEMPKKDLVS